MSTHGNYTFLLQITSRNPEEAGTATGHENNKIEQSQMYSRKYFPHLKSQ
jgi:hypothetical protein